MCVSPVDKINTGDAMTDFDHSIRIEKSWLAIVLLEVQAAVVGSSESVSVELLIFKWSL